MNQFTFYGKIVPIKDSEKFHPIERKTFEKSGWQMTSVKFNVVSGTNRIMCTTQGGCWADDKKNVSVKTFSASTINADGTKKKGEKIDIPWDKRLDPTEISKVAGFKHFVADLENKDNRSALRDAVKHFKDGDITDDLIEKTGCDTLEKAEKALEVSNNRRKQFITEWDFAEHMVKVLASDKIKDRIFRITGNQEIQYDKTKGRFYASYRVNKIDMMADGSDTSARMNVDFFFTDDCVNDDDIDETGKTYLNGWSTYYDSSEKKNGFMPITIVFRGDAKNVKGMKRKMSRGESEIRNVGITVDVIDGAEREEITEADLSEETLEDIEYGLTTLEAAIKALGGDKIGDRITELRYYDLMPRHNEVEETELTISDMVPASSLNVEEDEDDDL